MNWNCERFLLSLQLFGTASVLSAAEPPAGENPADHLPPYIMQLTAFGERADWSPDGKKILFLSKTFGDAMEIDVATRTIRNLTAQYAREYTLGRWSRTAAAVQAPARRRRRR